MNTIIITIAINIETKTVGLLLNVFINNLQRCITLQGSREFVAITLFTTKDLFDNSILTIKLSKICENSENSKQ